MAFLMIDDAKCAINTDLINLITDEGEHRSIVYGLSSQKLETLKTSMKMNDLISKINEANHAFMGISKDMSESETYFKQMNELSVNQKQTQRRLQQLELALAEEGYSHVVDVVGQAKLDSENQNKVIPNKDDMPDIKIGKRKQKELEMHM